MIQRLEFLLLSPQREFKIFLDSLEPDQKVLIILIQNLPACFVASSMILLCQTRLLPGLSFPKTKLPLFFITRNLCGLWLLDP